MTIKHIVLRSAPLYAVADSAAELETECLYGEQFDVSRREHSFSFGCLLTDGYQGWVPTTALGELPAATHRVLAPASWVRVEETIKSRELLPLSMGSWVMVKHQADAISCVALPCNTYGYIPASHIVALDKKQHDWVSVAESLLGVPYLWGGRTHSGLDCSALVQLAAQSAQIMLPRNSSQQQLEGSPLDSAKQLQRGDLVFWNRHVGVMQSDTLLLHANAHHMQVVSEPLQTATQRIAEKEGAITAMKRLASLR